MNIKNKKELAEYLPLILIVSFFLIHNIYLVFIGNIMSIYLIFKSSIFGSRKYKLKEIVNTKKNEDDRVEIMRVKNLKLPKEESSFTLAERIEELGFIPSKDEEYKEKVA